MSRTPAPINRRDLFRLRMEPPQPASGGDPAARTAAPPPAPRVYVMAYGPHEFTEFQLDDLGMLESLRGRYPVVWVNVDGNRHRAALDAVAQAFCLHPLAMEDVAQVGQHTTAEVYDDHLLVIARMVRLCPQLDVEQVSLFAGRDFVVSFQERPGDSLEPVRLRLRRGTGGLRRAGADHLLYALLDAMIDNCFPVVEHYMEALDTLEAEILEHRGHDVMARLHGIRRDLLALRRAVYPMRDALRALLRDRPEALVSQGAVVFLRDVQDHAVQVVELVESCREVSASLTDLHLSAVGNRTNDIMKVLTIFAAVFIPLSFVTGLYGMNVDAVPWWLRSLYVAEAAMVGITAGLLAFFWRRGWMGSRP